MVDDGSTDATAQIPRRVPGRMLFKDRLGGSRARNVGLGQAEGELVAHIDADALADPDWFSPTRRSRLRCRDGGPVRGASAWGTQLGIILHTPCSPHTPTSPPPRGGGPAAAPGSRTPPGNLSTDSLPTPNM